MNRVRAFFKHDKLFTGVVVFYVAYAIFLVVHLLGGW